MNFGVFSFFQCWAVIDFMKNLLILKDKLEWYFWIQLKKFKNLGFVPVQDNLDQNWWFTVGKSLI
jgi:hypothetical protein